MQRIYRYPLVVRVTHWLTALALVMLTMSGMQIFNAHPSLYAADVSKFNHPLLAIHGQQDAAGQPRGYVQFANGSQVTTTHILGWGADGMGGETVRAFPAWATIPGPQDLADGRRWHIFFAWLLVLCALFFAPSAFKLVPTGAELRAFPATLRQHLLPWKVRPSKTLNPLQKLTYFGVVFIVAPVVILSGLALSPTIDSWFHWLPALFGGRQFARIWHFAGMLALMLFFAVHVFMVAITGLINNVRSMTSGWYVLPAPEEGALLQHPKPEGSQP